MLVTNIHSECLFITSIILTSKISVETIFDYYCYQSRSLFLKRTKKQAKSHPLRDLTKKKLTKIFQNKSQPRFRRPIYQLRFPSCYQTMIIHHYMQRIALLISFFALCCFLVWLLVLLRWMNQREVLVEWASEIKKHSIFSMGISSIVMFAILKSSRGLIITCRYIMAPLCFQRQILRSITPASGIV